MKTTLDLAPDVAERLQRARRLTGIPLKTLVNDALRHGLDQIERSEASIETYRTQPWDLGKCSLPNLDDVVSALAFGEGHLDELR
jgi:hypothetical protein